MLMHVKQLGLKNNARPIHRQPPGRTRHVDRYAISRVISGQSIIKV